jgi:hypothetical protein
MQKIFLQNCFHKTLKTFNLKIEMIDNSIPLLTSNINSNIINSVQPASNTFTILSVFNFNNIYISNQLHLKQDILNASTNLFGNGTSIINISYGNISGKPTYFPADWNSTLANIPSLSNQTQINNLLNAKETF